jgi:hypothetical protein
MLLLQKMGGFVFAARFKESSAKLDKRQILLSAYSRQQYYGT